MEPRDGGASSSPHFVRNLLRGAGPRASPHFGRSSGSSGTGRKRRRPSPDATATAVAADDDAAGTAADAAADANSPDGGGSTAGGSPERPARHLRRRRRPRAIIIGQAPPPNLAAAEARDFLALDKPAPERRLARLAGCSVEELWRVFERKNVLAFWPGQKERAAKHHKAAGYTKHESAGDLFPLDDARLEALRIDLDSYALVVLLGLNVARSFNVTPKLLHQEVLQRSPNSRHATLLLVFPHPSGVSHYWNSPTNISRAEASLRAAMDAAGVAVKSGGGGA